LLSEKTTVLLYYIFKNRFEVLPEPNNPYVFFSCADDGRINKYDLRISKSCDEHCKRHIFLDLNPTHNPRRRNFRSRNQSNDINDDINSAHPQSEPETEHQSERRRRFFIRSPRDMSVTAISIRPDNPVYLAAACGDDTVRIYDKRFVKTSTASNIPYHRDSQVYQFIPTAMRQKQNEDPLYHHRMTSMKYDPNGGGDLCVSYSSDKVYLVRPGAGLIDKPRKTRKGAVRISKKQEQKSESKLSEVNMEIDKDLIEEKSFVGRGKSKEKNSYGERDTIPTSYFFENTIENQGIDNNDDEILSDQDNHQPEIQNMKDVKDDEEYEDDYMYSSDENDEDEDDIDFEKAYDEDIAMTYTGHLNSRTMVSFNFFIILLI